MFLTHLGDLFSRNDESSSLWSVSFPGLTTFRHVSFLKRRFSYTPDFSAGEERGRCGIIVKIKYRGCLASNVSPLYFSFLGSCIPFAAAMRSSLFMSACCIAPRVHLETETGCIAAFRLPFRKRSERGKLIEKRYFWANRN